MQPRPRPLVLVPLVVYFVGLLVLLVLCCFVWRLPVAPVNLWTDITACIGYLALLQVPRLHPVERLMRRLLFGVVIGAGAAITLLWWLSVSTEVNLLAIAEGTATLAFSLYLIGTALKRLSIPRHAANQY
jgi:hypothetical protein